MALLGLFMPAASKVIATERNHELKKIKITYLIPFSFSKKFINPIERRK